MTGTPPSPGLRRSIGRAGYFSLGFGTIIGSAWIVVLGDWLGAAGPGGAVLGFLAGGGRMGALIRAHDWSSSPLGEPESWPQSLRSALSICLHSSFPTAIYWGPELRLLYNDAWAPIPAERHPWALGRPAAEVWADIWPVVGPQFERVLACGEGLSAFDRMLPMVRGGQVGETYWNYSFTPIRGEDGSVRGHRSLRVPQLDLTVIDAEGRIVAHETRPARVADPAERRDAAAALIRALRLAAG